MADREIFAMRAKTGNRPAEITLKLNLVDKGLVDKLVCRPAPAPVNLLIRGSRAHIDPRVWKE